MFWSPEVGDSPFMPVWTEMTPPVAQADPSELWVLLGRACNSVAEKVTDRLASSVLRSETAAVTLTCCVTDPTVSSTLSCSVWLESREMLPCW